MTRGPVPQQALDCSLPVALARGFVTTCARGRGSVCDFIIHAPDYTAVILVVRSRRLQGSLAEIESLHAEPLGRIRLVPPGSCRVRELWACSPKGAMRFFRVEQSKLVELGRDGKVLGGG